MTVKVEVWSDIACPWCWVGKRSLDQAIGRFDDAVDVTWRAFELNPSAPLATGDPVDYAARLAEKYGSDRRQAQGFIDRMVEAGRLRGLELRFDRILPSNTFDAHRLVAWAATEGGQSRMKERLFAAYLNEGSHIGDHEVLIALAKDVGFDGEVAAHVLTRGDFADEVRGDEQIASSLGITGVPCFVFGERGFAVSGAQPPEALIEALQHAAAGSLPS